MVASWFAMPRWSSWAGNATPPSSPPPPSFPPSLLPSSPSPPPTIACCFMRLYMYQQGALPLIMTWRANSLTTLNMSVRSSLLGSRQPTILRGWGQSWAYRWAGGDGPRPYHGHSQSCWLLRARNLWPPEYQRVDLRQAHEPEFPKYLALYGPHW